MHNDQRQRGARPDVSNVRTVQQYAAQAIGRAELTRAAAQTAVEKATRPDVRELAGYELMVAKAMVSCLRDLGAQAPAMSQDARSALEMIANASKGNAFDRAYIAAQSENHAYLRDLTAAYLESSDARASDPQERQGRQLATMALCAATEHAAVANRISREIRS
jgi:predicted outer membrane protein